MKKIIACCLVVLVYFGNVVWAGMTAEEAISESYRRYRLIKSERVAIEVKDGSGQDKRMVWQAVYDYGEPGHDVEMSLFTYPPMDAGLKVMIERDEKLEYDRIVVKRPSYNKQRTVSGRNEGKSYAGDFNFQDARESANMKFSKYDWRREDGAIVQTPKNGTETLYAIKKYWLDDQYRIKKIELYDNKGRLWKIWRNQEFEDLKEAWRVNLIEIENVERKRTTRISFSNRIQNIRVTKEMFDEKIFFAK